MNIRSMADKYRCTGLIARALTYYPQIAERLWECPVNWNSRLKNSAGMAHRNDAGNVWIDLHPGLQKEAEAHLRKTFLHEVAHIMDFLLTGKSDHGLKWYEMMFLLAQTPVRCHNYASCKASTKEVLSLEDLLT